MICVDNKDPEVYSDGMETPFQNGGNVVDFMKFRSARRGLAGFDSVHCPLCDALTPPRDRSIVIAYVCEGVAAAHSRFEWTHAPDDVATAIA